MVDLMYCLASLLFSDIPLSYYYINLKSSTVFCLISRERYLSLGIFSTFSVSFVTVSELFCGKAFENFVILSAVLLLVKSPVTSALFKIALFKAVLSASVADFFVHQEVFGYIYCLHF